MTHRHCKKQHDGQNIGEVAITPPAEEPRLNTSGVKLQELHSKSSVAVFGKTEKPSDIRIHMKDEPKSVAIEIPEILVTSPLSEIESQSESSSDESSSDEGEYILP